MLSREKVPLAEYNSEENCSSFIRMLALSLADMHRRICGSSLPFCIASRTKIIGWINPKMKSNRKEKGKKKEIIKGKNSTRHHSRKSSLSIRRRSRIARFNEKTADFPPNPIFFFAESRSSVGKSVENVIASVGSEEGELRKKTRFFNLPVARTWLHAYVCKAAPKKVRRIRGTNVAVLGRGSLPRIRTTVVSPVEKTLKL